jgi:hypothetical protein
VNWSRGLLRLWIAFTVLWVGAMCIAFYRLLPPAYLPIVGNVKDPTGAPLPPGFEPVPELKPWMIKFWAIALAWAIAVPSGLFSAGWARLWIGRGFRSSGQ